MKYKRGDFVLPRLGEYLIMIDNNDMKSIGYFYEKQGKRLYRMVSSIIPESESSFYIGEMVKFSYLPAPKDFNEYPPPVGRAVVVKSFIKKWGVNFSEYVNVKDREIRTDIEYRGWYNYEDFDED